MLAPLLPVDEPPEAWPEFLQVREPCSCPFWGLAPCWATILDTHSLSLSASHRGAVLRASLASARARAAASAYVVQSGAVLACAQLGRSGTQACASEGSTSSCLPPRPWCLLCPTSPGRRAGTQGHGRRLRGRRWPLLL